MTEFEGRYFFPRSTRLVDARGRIAGAELTVETVDGVVAREPLARVRISPRLGNIARRFDLPDGARFETDENDRVDAVLHAETGKRHDVVHRLERSWKWALGALAVSIAAVYLFVVFGIPAVSAELARATPASADAVVTKGTMDTLERTVLSPSKLSAAETVRAQGLFANVAAQGARGRNGYALVIRDSKTIGPNAFALPDGTVVLTDQLWEMVERDEEIEGVFAHEIAHVDRRHGLQRMYQAVFLPALLAVVTGDISQIGQLAAVLPGVLLDASYSQALEQQADDDAVVTLRRMNLSTKPLADLLERMENKLCGKDECVPNWLGSHPNTASRAAKLREDR